MTDVQIPLAPKPAFACRVTNVCGQFFDMQSMLDWTTFLKISKSDGFVLTEFAIIPWSSIASIVRTDISIPQAALAISTPAGMA